MAEGLLERQEIDDAVDPETGVPTPTMVTYSGERCRRREHQARGCRTGRRGGLELSASGGRRRRLVVLALGEQAAAVFDPEVAGRT